MKPTKNYGLSDSLIDAVRKSVEEAKLHPNQQKLDVHEPEKDELTSQDFKKLRAGKKAKDDIDTHPKSMDEDEQIDELSVHKMLKYTDAVEISRDKLNTKWDEGTATKKQKNKVLGHEAGLARAAAGVKAKTGKNPNEIGKLSRMKYAITKEEYEQMDEANRRGGNRFLNTREKDAIQKKMKPLDPNATVKYKDNYSITRGLPHEEQLKRHIHQATGHHVHISPTTHDMHDAATGAKIAHDAYNSGGAGQYGGPGGAKHTAKSLVHAVKKFHKEEYEQMDEAPLRTVNALVGYPKLNKKVAAKGTPGSEDERNKAAAGLKRDRSGLGRRAYTGDQHYDVRREEVEQMDEVKLADLPRRKVVGKSYGADYVDPEGADETAADMKKAEPKRKSGPQGTMKRRFIKDKSKLRMQYK